MSRQQRIEVLARKIHLLTEAVGKKQSKKEPRKQAASIEKQLRKATGKKAEKLKKELEQVKRALIKLNLRKQTGIKDGDDLPGWYDSLKNRYNRQRKDPFK